MAKQNINEKELQEDIKAMKAAKTKEEVDQILAKYESALQEDSGDAPKKQNKKAPKVVPVPKAKKENKKDDKKDNKKNEKASGGRYNGKYEVYQTSDGFVYDLKASNGQILVSSEVYASKESVLSAIEAVKKNVEVGEIKVFDDKNGKHQFKLTAKNHRVLVVSANYDDSSSAQRAAESFKKFAVTADIVEIDASEADSKEDTPITVDKKTQKTGGKFVIFKEENKFSWAFQAANGQVLCQQDGYSSKSAAEGAIQVFRDTVLEGSFKSSEDKRGRCFFKLYSTSGRVVAIGESYPSKASAESAAQSVVTLIKKATVEMNEEA